MSLIYCLQQFAPGIIDTVIARNIDFSVLCAGRASTTTLLHGVMLAIPISYFMCHYGHRKLAAHNNLYTNYMQTKFAHLLSK